jgi:hypothetical protein
LLDVEGDAVERDYATEALRDAGYAEQRSHGRLRIIGHADISLVRWRSPTRCRGALLPSQVFISLMQRFPRLVKSGALCGTPVCRPLRGMIGDTIGARKR